MYNDNTIRSLTNIQSTSSTSRVLNLLRVYFNNLNNQEYFLNPFFNSRVLNKSIILKHRIRRDENELFSFPRTVATKIMIPMDCEDLRYGARCIFIGQKNYQNQIKDILCSNGISREIDIKVLSFLDEMPSLDPFLLKEGLSKLGIKPSSCYFDISVSDISKMFSFVEKEMMPLVEKSFGGTSVTNYYVSKLAQKIMSNKFDETFDTFRTVLKLDTNQFEEHMFYWKAFMYYKWQLNNLLPKFNDVFLEIKKLKPVNFHFSDMRHIVVANKDLIQQGVSKAFSDVKLILTKYNDVYREFIIENKVDKFRKFLLASPSCFIEIGVKLSAIEHIVTFWRYKFGANNEKNLSVSCEEICDIFSDFRNGLNFKENIPVSIV